MADSMTIAAAAEDTSDRELVFRRTFSAPPALVFEAWTNPAHLVNWWGPTGFRTSIWMYVRAGIGGW